MGDKLIKIIVASSLIELLYRIDEWTRNESNTVVSIDIDLTTELNISATIISDIDDKLQPNSNQINSNPQ